MIVAVVLAAGAARRFGSQKLVHPVHGTPLVRTSVERVLAAHPAETIVVVGHDAPAVRAALEGLPVTIVENPLADSGMSSSIRAGVATVPPDAAGVLIALGDQPLDRGEVIPTLIARLAKGGAAIVAPRYRDAQGTPVLFARSIFPELTALRGDHGARSVVERDPARVAFVDFDFDMPRDIDLRADAERA